MIRQTIGALIILYFKNLTEFRIHTVNVSFITIEHLSDGNYKIYICFNKGIITWNLTIKNVIHTEPVKPYNDFVKYFIRYVKNYQCNNQINDQF